jgi:hypothetical protein
MRTKMMAGVAALALAASTIIAVAPANARWYHHGYHHGGGAFAGFAAGALIGGALAGAGPYGYGPYGYGYAPGPYYGSGYAGGGAVQYCLSRFKSYDPGSGTYLGYDGARHPCP